MGRTVSRRRSLLCSACYEQAWATYAFDASVDGVALPHQAGTALAGGLAAGTTAGTIAAVLIGGTTSAAGIACAACRGAVAGAACATAVSTTQGLPPACMALRTWSSWHINSRATVSSPMLKRSAACCRRSQALSAH